MTRLSDEALADLKNFPAVSLNSQRIKNALPLLIEEVTETRALVKELVEALEQYAELIQAEYSSEEAAALDGHPIDRVARKQWDQGWAALSRARKGREE